MTVADLLAGSLKHAGTRTLFGVPGGGSNLDLMEAARQQGLGFTLSQTETGAALMAAAQAEITGAPGACLCTLGPGVSSIVNGVAHAWLDRVPLVVFSDTLPAGVRGRYEHQNLPHSALLGPITKLSIDLSARNARPAVAAALACALANPAGPVHLDCSPEIAAAEPDETTVLPPPADIRSPVSIDDEAERLLRGARRPVVIAGLHARALVTAAALRLLAESRTIPVLTTYKAKGVLPDDHPLYAGLFTLGVIERPLIEAADLLLTFGLDPVELLPRPWPATPSALHCARAVPPLTQIAGKAYVTGELPETVTAVHAALPTSAWKEEEIAREHERQRAAVRAGAPFAPGEAVVAIADAVGPDARITIDAGAHMFPAMALLRATRPRQILISNGLSTMGYALPAGIGAALLNRSAPVIAITGDAGLLMCLGELATAGRENLALVIVVFADDELSLIRLKQDRRGLPSLGVHLGPVDWQRVAGGFGFRVFQATDTASLRRHLDRALAGGGPALVEVRVNPTVYGEMAMALRG